MGIPDFPKGFESWQKTHFEVVEVLCYMRDLEAIEQPKNFAEYVDRSATENLYNLALMLTNKFEAMPKALKEDQTLFDAIETFVWSEVQTL